MENRRPPKSSYHSAWRIGLPAPSWCPPPPLFPPVPFRPHPQVAPLSTAVPTVGAAILYRCGIPHARFEASNGRVTCGTDTLAACAAASRPLGAIPLPIRTSYLLVLRPTAARLRFLLDRCEDRPLVVPACELDNLHGPASAQCNQRWVHVICSSNASNASNAALTTTERSGRDSGQDRTNE